MDFSSTEEWAKLSPAERLEYCRKAAAEAETQAANASPPMRDVYARLASQWRKRAAEVEREIGKS